MFSHLVTAAKGFLKRQDTEGASPDTTIDNDPRMARATRQSNGAEKPEHQRSPAANGNGVSRPSSAGNKGGKNNKRRRSSIQDPEDKSVPDESTDGISGSKPAQKDSSAKGGHIRFGSEEPESPEIETEEKVSEAGSQNQDEEEDDDSDDDAPETVDNSAQLSKIKLQAQKREQARQRLVSWSIPTSLPRRVGHILTMS